MAVTNSLNTINQPISIVSGTGSLNIGTDSTSKNISIGNNTGVTSITLDAGGGGGNGITIGPSVITIGGTTGSSPLLLRSGASGLQATMKYILGGTTGSSAVNFVCGTGVTGVGNYSSPPNINIGDTTGSKTVTLQSGTGGVLLIGTAPVIGNPSADNTLIFQAGTGGVTYPSLYGTTQGNPNHGVYYGNTSSATQRTYTLPTSPVVGGMIYIGGAIAFTTGSCKIAQNASQQIVSTANSTTAGVLGSVTSTSSFTWIELQYVGSNIFVIRNISGTWVFV